jgi:hypothetical protein
MQSLLYRSMSPVLAVSAVANRQGNLSAFTENPLLR